jgi:hypothetical protein
MSRATRHDGRTTAALATCAVVSVALHLSLFPLLDAGGPRPGRVGTSHPARGVQVRMLASPERPATGALAAMNPTPVEVPRVVATAPRSTPAPETAPIAASLPDAAAAVEPASPPHGEDGDDAYLPRAALTVAPQPRASIVVPYPAFDDDAGRYTARLSVFIDETGAGAARRCGNPGAARAAAGRRA